MRRDRSSRDLLAAYVDGVSELTAEERRALEERLAADDALRAEAAETRALLGRLRELPGGSHGSGGEPDWAELERSIMDAVGPEVPRPWWRRLGWRWVMPAAALAVGAAILALVVRAPEREADPAPVIGAPAPSGAGAGAPAPSGAPAPGSRDTMALWLDGEGIEVVLDAEELLDVPWESDHNLEDLLPASDLAWVDELVEDELARAEALLNDPELTRTVRRKRS